MAGSTPLHADFDKTIPSEVLPAIEQELLNRFAAASGDPNPIHLDPDVARQAGLPGVIAHGMLVAGFASRRAVNFMAERFADRVSPEFTASPNAPRLTRFQSRFKGMVLLGDVLTVGGSVRSRTEQAWVLDIQVRNSSGVAVVIATAEFAIG